NLQLVAAPALYYRFDHWTGDAVGTNNPLQIVLSSNLTGQAVFVEACSTNFPTPLWWLAANGYTNDFESAVLFIGANGHPLWQSYIAGLDPNNPASRLLLTVTSLSNGTNLAFGWNTVTGRIYSLWFSANLTNDFAPLAGATNLPWTVQAFTNNINSAGFSEYFRLEVKKP